MQKQRWKKIGFLVALIVLIAWIWGVHRGSFSFSRMQAVIQEWGIWAPVAFIGLYATVIVFLIPGSAMTVLGGLLFGPWFGTLYSMIGAVCGATVAFLIARFVAEDWVANKTGGKLKQLKEGAEQQGWKFVAVVRLIPIIPFTMLNYALGLTKVSLSGYVVASSIFMLPACFAYTYLGSLGEVAMKGNINELIGKGFIAIGLLVVLSIFPWLLKTWRKK